MNLSEVAEAGVPELLERILQLPSKEQYTRGDLLVNEFLLHRDSPLEIYYAPFDHINPAARIVLVGVTPGWTQMELSFRAVRQVLPNNGTADEALAAVKREAAFGGAMRRNLVAMLDEIGIADSLDIQTTELIFTSQAHLVHATSAVRYPVFRNGDNYSGHAPKLSRHALLSRYVDEVLAAELDEVGAALVVPLGNAAGEATDRLIESSKLRAERVLQGFPHPSGLNPHRVPTFNQNKSRLRAKTAVWFAGL